MHQKDQADKKLGTKMFFVSWIFSYFDFESNIFHVIESIEGFSLENSILTFNVHYTYTCTIHKVN